MNIPRYIYKYIFELEFEKGEEDYECCYGG